MSFHEGLLDATARARQHRIHMAKRIAPPNTPVPPGASLSELQKAARNCKACDLWKRGTQTVFGEGRPDARIMLVGEQPGHQEDLEGKPFVGPAGRLLDQALEEAGIDRKKVYVTNAVKHFKWEPRGKRRIHKKPNAAEIAACRPWLDAEITALRPRVIVCLGATAAQALLGRDFRVTQHRGEFLVSPLAEFVTATMHPSSILRAPDEETRHAEKKLFIQDLRKISKIIS
jgi:uracil-DNA glycosylase